MRLVFVGMLSGLLLFAVGCSPISTAEKQPSTPERDALIVRAEKAVREHKLSEVKLACMKFTAATEPFQRFPTVDIHEVHNKECGGDPTTSPRIFSVAFDDKTGAVWSDAKSLVGQMEVVGTESPGRNIKNGGALGLKITY